VNWTMIGAMGELVGALAVVLTLFYLARQVRDASREAQRDRWRALNAELTKWADGFAADDAYADVVLRGFQDRRSLQPREVFRFYSSLFAFFRAWEALFEFTREGGVHREGAEALARTTRDILGFPGVQAYWADRRHWFTAAFAAHVDPLIESAQPTLLASYNVGTLPSESSPKSTA